MRPLYSSNLNSFSFFPGQSFFSSLADKISFDFSTQTKCKSQYLTLDVVAQFISIFDRIEFYPYIHAMFQDSHYHKKTTTKATKFAGNQNVILLKFIKKLSKLPFIRFFYAGNTFIINVFINGKSFSFAKILDP